MHREVVKLFPLYMGGLQPLIKSACVELQVTIKESIKHCGAGHLCPLTTPNLGHINLAPGKSAVNSFSQVDILFCSRKITCPSLTNYLHPPATETRQPTVKFANEGSSFGKYFGLMSLCRPIESHVNLG